ncbi:MAG: TetR/AcrR family transcriptional regulator [Pseudomonadota bacterium]
MSLLSATQERLIIQAERLFAERGIDGVTMRMICDAAKQKFAGSVQYHFGDLAGLLYAVFEYRETQLQPRRRELLEQGRRDDRLDDVRFLLRVLFEPNFRLYTEQGNSYFLRCHAAYLTTHRPRGVEHPVDRGSPATQAMREAMDLLEHRLSPLGAGRAALRLEYVGTMLLYGMAEFDANPSRAGISAEAHFEELLDMMTQAITVLPRPRQAAGKGNVPA